MYVIVSIYATDPVREEYMVTKVEDTLESAIEFAQRTHLSGYEVISITKVSY